MARRKTALRGVSASTRITKVAIYIRVSTIHQVDKDSIPMQKKDLIAYCQLILGTDNYEIFEDAGYSGKNTDRPAFQDMMGRIRKGEFTHVLVWKIDRISRNLLDFAEMYEELQSLRVTFVSKNEQFDTSTAIGEAMLKIVLVFAELERNMTSERVTATMISRANNGQWNGGRVPFGYSYDSGTSTLRKQEFSDLIYHRLLHFRKAHVPTKDGVLTDKLSIYAINYACSYNLHSESKISFITEYKTIHDRVRRYIYHPSAILQKLQIKEGEIFPCSNCGEPINILKMKAAWDNNACPFCGQHIRH